MGRSNFTSMTSTVIQIQTVQAAWDEFIRLRRKETGYAYYTPSRDSR